MKKIIVLAILVALAGPSHLEAAECDSGIHDAHLTVGERADTVSLLESTALSTLAQIAGLSDAAWDYKPTPDKWSVAEVVEHLMLAEGTFTARIEALLETEPNPQWAEQTAGRVVALRSTVLDRSNKFPANERVVPRGKLERRKVVERFLEARQQTLSLVRETQRPIKAYTSESGIFDTISIYHWLMIAGLHNQRHNAQIADILADPGLPR